MTEDGFTAFGRRFSNRVSDWKEELLTLEREGAVYEQWILDEADGGPGLYRIRLQPAEIYGYVAAIVGWDEYLAAGFDAVADRQLASRAAASACERPTYDDRATGPVQRTSSASTSRRSSAARTPSARNACIPTSRLAMRA